MGAEAVAADTAAIPEAFGSPTDFPASVDVLVPSGAKARARANIAAIETLLMLRLAQRPATLAEQKTLAAWSGWGAIPGVFDSREDSFAVERQRLQELLSADEYRRAEASILNAHYTDPALASVIWESLERAGFSGGRVLEPGCGSGTFIAHAPKSAVMVGVELDPMTAEIASVLYPSAQIRNEGFETTRVPQDSFAAVVGNVPFGDFALHDPAHNPDRHSIHNHFIIKSLALTAPGGYVAVLTSRYTMDAASPKARRAIAALGDLVGAVRLPSRAFSRVAGTSVVTDLLVLRRREHGRPDASVRWLDTGDLEFMDADSGDLSTIAVNKYFLDHPEHVLGTMDLGHGIHGSRTLLVEGDSGAELAVQLGDALTDIVDRARAQELALSARAQDLTVINESGFDPGLITEGDLPPEIPAYTLRYNELTKSIEYWDGKTAWLPNKTPKARIEETRRLIELRDTADALIRAQHDGRPQADREQLRGHLNHLYDSYVAKYGLVNRFTWVYPKEPDQAAHDKKVAAAEARWRKATGTKDNPYRGPVPEELAEQWDLEGWQAPAPHKRRSHLDGGMRNDPGWTTIAALESFDEDTSKATKATIFSTDQIIARTDQLTADTPEEALAISLDRAKGVDMALIAQLLNVSDEDAQALVQGLVYPSLDDPDELIPAVSALSGNVREKYEAAAVAAEANEIYRPYLAALREVIPADRTAAEITVRPGAAWVSPQIHAQFARETFGLDSVTVEHVAGRWVVDLPKHQRDSALLTETWGLEREGADAASLFEDACNSRSAVFHDDKGELLAETTFAAQAKADKIVAEFARWVFADPDREGALVAEYNRRFNSYVAPTYDGSHLALPGLSNHFEPHYYQRNAVARIINEPTTLLDHVVGAGKSMVLFAAAIELRRLGLVRQPWLVVPGHILDQVAIEAKQWYPAANILVGAAATNPEGRRRLIAQSASSDWDLVIISQSAFTNISVDPTVREAHIESQLDNLREQLETSESVRSKKMIERAIKGAKEKLESLSAQTGKDVGLRFEDTGCDYLLVDEAHSFKNKHRICNIDELSCTTAAERAEDLSLKMSVLRRMRRDEARAAGVPEHKIVERVATFATGTPIANSLGELWVMQTYMRMALLEAAGVADLSDWGATFTATHSTIEVNATGTKLRSVTRVGKYTNLLELLALTNSYTDVVTRDQVPVPLPKLIGNRRRVISIKPSVETLDFIADLGWRADHLDPKAPEIDNILKIANDGRNVSLDPRLAGLAAPEVTRAAVVADEIMRVHLAHADRQYLDPNTGAPTERTGALQIVFCDRGTPSKNTRQFTIYQAIKDELIARGMPEEQIRFIHEARKPSEVTRLRNQCNRGEVSVLLGSTEKMGTGTNVQFRLAALHHVDVPWRPADLEQREGRIIRQGNQNAEVEILCYVTESSYDTVMWQTVEAKALFIDQMRRNTVRDTEIEDLSGGDIGAAAAETKAIATGDPRYIRQVQLDDEVKRLTAMERAHHESARNRDSRVRYLEKQIPWYGGAIEQLAPVAARAAQMRDLEQAPEVLVDEVRYKSSAETALAAVKELDRIYYVARDQSSTQFLPTRITIAGQRVLAARRFGDGALQVILGVTSESIGSGSKEIEHSKISAARYETEAGNPKARGILRQLENIFTGLPEHAHGIRATHERCKQDLDDLLKNPPGAFEFADELAEKQAELSALTLDLKLAAESAEAKAKAAAAEERLAARGRKPGWTLLLNPSPALVIKHGYESAADMRAAVRKMEHEAALEYEMSHRADSAAAAIAEEYDESARVGMEYGLLAEASARPTRTPRRNLTRPDLTDKQGSVAAVLARSPYSLNLVTGPARDRRAVMGALADAARAGQEPVAVVCADEAGLGVAIDSGLTESGFVSGELPDALHGAWVLVPDAQRWSLNHTYELAERARQQNAKLILTGDTSGPECSALFGALAHEIPWTQALSDHEHTEQNNGPELLLDRLARSAEHKHHRGEELTEAEELASRLSIKRVEISGARRREYERWQAMQRRITEARERDQDGPDLSL